MRTLFEDLNLETKLYAQSSAAKAKQVVSASSCYVCSIDENMLQ